MGYSKYHHHPSLSYPPYKHRLQAATLASSPDTDLLASFYTHFTKEYPEYQSEEQKARISVCFQVILLKLITLVGAPRVLRVLGLLAKAEGNVEVKSEASTLNEKWYVSLHPSLE